MRIDEDLAAVAAFTEADQFADVRRHVDPEWVRDALEATGTATVRRRRLPAEQVVWLVIGMAMFRKWPIHDLVGRLNLVLPGRTRTVVPSSVAEAREKVGAEPLERLFDMSARKWAHASARRHALSCSGPRRRRARLRWLGARDLRHRARRSAVQLSAAGRTLAGDARGSRSTLPAGNEIAAARW